MYLSKYVSTEEAARAHYLFNNQSSDSEDDEDDLTTAPSISTSVSTSSPPPPTKEISPPTSSTTSPSSRATVPIATPSLKSAAAAARARLEATGEEEGEGERQTTIWFFLSSVRKNREREGAVDPKAASVEDWELRGGVKVGACVRCGMEQRERYVEMWYELAEVEEGLDWLFVRSGPSSGPFDKLWFDTLSPPSTLPPCPCSLPFFTSSFKVEPTDEESEEGGEMRVRVRGEEQEGGFGSFDASSFFV